MIYKILGIHLYSSWFIVPQTLKTSLLSVQISFVVNEATYGLHPRVRAGCQENEPHDTRFGIFSPPTTSGEGRREGLEVEFNCQMANRLSQSGLFNEVSIKT